MEIFLTDDESLINNGFSLQPSLHDCHKTKKQEKRNGVRKESSKGKEDKRVGK